MKISVVGLGFVGTVTGACFCELGHEVVGVDLDPGKVDLFARGRAPILEPHIDELLEDVWRSGRLRGTTDLIGAIAETELTFVCVGTLRNPDGTQDISAVENVVTKIGEAIAQKGTFHSVVIRSTVLPGTTRGRLMTLLAQTTGSVAGKGFGLANNPEFTREGSAVADFREPRGSLSAKSIRRQLTGWSRSMPGSNLLSFGLPLKQRRLSNMRITPGMP